MNAKQSHVDDWHEASRTARHNAQNNYSMVALTWLAWAVNIAGSLDLILQLRASLLALPLSAAGANFRCFGKDNHFTDNGLGLNVPLKKSIAGDGALQQAAPSRSSTIHG